MIFRKMMLAVSLVSAIGSHANEMPVNGKETVLDVDHSLSDSSKVYDIDQVIVVGQPKEVYRLRQQPISSNSFGSFDVQQLGVRDFRELAQYVPNFVMPNYGSRLSSAMYVRGIGSRVNSPAVGIYLDGIPVVSKAAFNLHNYQLSRVDVLRGPQGTLYGQNTEGGLVRMYSRDPFLYEGTDVKLGYGSKYYRNMEVAHYHKLNDNVALSFAGFYDGQTGFFRNTTTGERADKYNEAGGKMLLKTRLNACWTMDFLANYQYVDQNGFPYGKLDLETGKAELPTSTFAGIYRRNNLLTGLNIGYQGDAFQFTSVSSYQYVKDKMLMDQDYLAADYMHILQEQLQNSFTQEFDFKSRRPVGGFWHWATGAFFSAQWLRTNGPVYFDDALTSPIAAIILKQMTNAMPPAMADRVSLSVEMAAPGLYHTPQYNLGFYHESNFDITSRFTATLGLRFDYMQAKIHYESSAYMAMTAQVMGTEKTYTLKSVLDGRVHDNFNQLLPKFGLTYKLSDNGSNIYATVSKGYRAGGYNIQMFSDILQTELMANRSQATRGDYDVPHTDADYENVNNTIAYKPETSWNYELGTHLNLFDNMLHFDLSAFYMQVRNQQLSVMAGNYGYGRMMVNAGKSHSCGIEASMRGQLINGNLEWAVNYGLTRAVFDEYVDGEGNTAVSYEDKYVPYIPQHTFSAMADYRITTGGRLLKNIILGANVNAQGKTYWDNANSYQQDFYAVWGAHVDADFGVMTFSFWGRNLTNTNYNTFAIDSSATGKKEYFAQRGNPFQCGVDVRLHF